MKVRIGVGVMILALAGVDLATAQVQPPQDRINTALTRARQVGIPVALLESKIAEGKAKGVSLDRVAEAVERRQATLEKASQALRGQPDAASSLSVGADAVEAGVSDAALKAIADNAPRDRRNVAIAVLTQLVEQGHASTTALERVTEALKREHWARELAQRGPLATFEASQVLWEHMRTLRPDWPSDDEQRQDLADHIALKRLIDRAAGAFLAAAPR